jgi:hypothetical protein
VAAAALDDRFSDSHHLGVDGIGVTLFERGRSDLLRRPQGDQHHARAARFDQGSIACRSV